MTRMLALGLAMAMLAACDQGETAAGPVERAAAAEPEPQPTSLASPGTYSVTEIDGTKMTSVFAADHTYSNTVHGNKTEAGSWAIVGGRTCLTPSEGEGAVARCYTDSAPGRDGTFTATPDVGDPITVKKIA
jgi:hypothetical protein